VIAITGLSNLPRIAGIQLAIRFLEFIVLAKIVRGAWTSKILFWGIGCAISLISSVIIVVPLKEKAHQITLERVSGYASAVVLGLYFYFGALALHNGLTQMKPSSVLVVFVMFLSFAVSAAIPAGIR
jgi:hypothetical protein